MIESRWVAVGFDKLHRAEAFRREYVDQPPPAEFEYKCSISKEQKRARRALAPIERAAQLTLDIDILLLERFKQNTHAIAQAIDLVHKIGAACPDSSVAVTIDFQQNRLLGRR